MDIDLLNDWGTFVGAVVAAVAAVWNLALQFRGKRGKYKVRLGSSVPQAVPETFMHVTNLSDHLIVISDYGFIQDDRGLFPFRLEFDLDPSLQEGDGNIYRGTPHLKRRGSTFEVGMIFLPKVIGAFAKSVTQEHPNLWFHKEVSFVTRIRVRTRVRVKGMYG